MKTIESIPRQRLFLPPTVRLQADLSGEQVSFISTHADGRAHEHLVRELQVPRESEKPLPYLWLDELNAEVVVVDAKGTLDRRLRDFGFDRCGSDVHEMRVDGSLALDSLAWAAIVGIRLHDDAWTKLEDAGRAHRVSPLAWNRDDPAFGEREGAWASRLRDKAELRTLLEELRGAIRSSGDSAVHLVPTSRGELLRRKDRPDAGGDPHAGCGAVVLHRDQTRLRVYLPGHEWISWGLQRALLDAWAEESFGEGTPWHWG